jgi:hypothetical protein
VARTFKGYASKHSANQVQPCRVRRSQVRTVTVDFNGALETSELIESVTWECTSPWITLLSDAAVADNQKSVSVVITFNYGGCGAVKATATLSDGSKLNYEFGFAVSDCPLYPSSTYDSASGPYSLTAVAP